jgi:hypothetical protein|tara:strand:- start:1100 stop:1375 length:276 start_codon:yes stop_codon:yes gene_type:complete
MEDEILKKAIETIEKFGHAFGSRTEGSHNVAEYKMMITADDGTSFIFEMEYDEEGELDSKFMVLQEDEDGNPVPVSLDQEDSDEIPNMLLN